MSAYEEEEQAQKDMLTPESMAGDVHTPFSVNSVHRQDATPFMSLFDNPVVSTYLLSLRAVVEPLAYPPRAISK